VLWKSGCILFVVYCCNDFQERLWNHVFFLETSAESIRRFCTTKWPIFVYRVTNAEINQRLHSVGRHARSDCLVVQSTCHQCRSTELNVTSAVNGKTTYPLVGFSLYSTVYAALCSGSITVSLNQIMQLAQSHHTLVRVSITFDIFSNITFHSSVRYWNLCH